MAGAGAGAAAFSGLVTSPASTTLSPCFSDAITACASSVINFMNSPSLSILSPDASSLRSGGYVPQTSAISPSPLTSIMPLMHGIIHSSSNVTFAVNISSGSSSANTPSGILLTGAAAPPPAGFVTISAFFTLSPFLSEFITASLSSVTNFIKRPFLSISSPDLSSLRSGGYVPQTSAISPRPLTSISPLIVGIMHSSSKVTFAVTTSSGSSSGNTTDRSKPPAPASAAFASSPFITAAKARILSISSVKSVSSCESSCITSISFLRSSEAAKSSSYIAGLSYCTELSSRII